MKKGINYSNDQKLYLHKNHIMGLKFIEFNVNFKNIILSL
jgi:hypothetical protein